MSYSQYIKDVVTIAEEAGKQIMFHYHHTIEAMEKADHTPVTKADLEANTFIVNALKNLTPEIPVVAEENTAEENNKAVGHDRFWVVDPLDGTKSFIKKTGEFTVNIALIEDKVPTLGAVYVPAQRTSYFTGEDGYAYKHVLDESDLTKISVNTINQEEPLKVVASLSHRTKETEDFLKTLNVESYLSAASSLKFCLVAEGKADIYPRLGTTMEWDTAAAHAVLRAAGGKVVELDDSPLFYGKEGFVNPFFIAKGNITNS